MKFIKDEDTSKRVHIETNGFNQEEDGIADGVD